MKRSWTTDGLVEHWTLLPAERALVDDSKAERTRLGFALLPKWFQAEGRFPRHREGRFPRHRNEVPAPVVALVAQQLGVAATGYLAYDWTGARSSSTGPPSVPS